MTLNFLDSIVNNSTICLTEEMAQSMHCKTKALAVDYTRVKQLTSRLVTANRSHTSTVVDHVNLPHI